MRQRGRKSAAALQLVPNVGVRKSRIGPRAGASAAVKEIICELIATVDSDWFRPSDGPLLESYAEAIALERKAYAEIEIGGPVINGKISPWVGVAERATRAVVAVSARLRLSPQHRTDPKSAGRAKGPGPSIYEMGND